MWRVVGGGDKGGILVREDKALNSAEVPGRLATGALIEELELQGKRLHFRLASGGQPGGPSEGWVSTELQGRVLVERADGGAPGAPAPAAPASGAYDDAALLARYKAGGLDGDIAGFRAVLRDTLGPNGPPVEDLAAPRRPGLGMPFSGTWVPPADPGGLPRLVLTGDSITHGPPACPTAPWSQAIALRNASRVAVENVAWGGIMSMSLLRPSAFNLPLPTPKEVGGQYVCVLIGTNDAMAMAGNEEWADSAYAAPHPEGVVGPCRLPQDWRTSCRPSVELYEKSLGALVREYHEAGAKVAVATVPLLGEDTSEAFNEKQKLARSPFLVCKELGDAARRVAATEGCSILPLFECMVHRAQQLKRPPNKWTPMTFGGRVVSGLMQQEAVKKQTGQVLPYEELGAEKTRAELLYDLCHFNESGGALHAALVQAWLDAQLSA